MQIYEELKARGLIAQVTDEEEIRELVNNGKATFYIGFDPTADSLHVGHFMALCLMKRLQMAGNRPIALIGGGTGYIGDPSGRMEKGLSFLEFNYMIMQSYDFYHMFQTVGCNMQFGGDDQWSNMLGGTELIRRKLGKDAYAMTITLLMNSEGKKMGKTASGAVWLDPNKTSPYDFYQYWRNVGDADVLKCIRMLTFLPLEQIDEMDTWQGSQLNTAKEILAFELTKLVHGEEEAAKAQEAARALFGGGGDSANMPCTKLCREDFTAEGEIDILTLLVKCGLAASKGEARRLVQQGGVTVCGQKVADIEARFSCKDCCGEGAVIKKGKKVYHKAVLEEQ